MDKSPLSSGFERPLDARAASVASLAWQEIEQTRFAPQRPSSAPGDHLAMSDIYAQTVRAGQSNPKVEDYFLNQIDDSTAAHDKLKRQSDALADIPSPTVDSLRSKYPDAGLPAKMIGTTVDSDIMYKLPIQHPPTAEDQKNLDDYADAVMAKAQGMNLNTVRLGAYWNQIMADPNNPNYAELDAFMKAAQNHGLKVVLTVGEKAPGDPEYYFPGYDPYNKDNVTRRKDSSPSPGLPPTSSDDVLKFVKGVADHVAGETTDSGAPGIGNAVAMWQVENEPYDESGPDKYWLSPDQVNKELAVLHDADKRRRPVMETFWSDNRQVQRLNQAFANPDVDLIGIDVYSRISDEKQNGKDTKADNIRTEDIPDYVNNLARASGKPAMIAELQADPWHNNAHPENNFDPTSDTISQLYEKEKGNGFSDVLFWRLDANLYQDNHIGDQGLTAREIIDRIRNPLNYGFSESDITEAERRIAANAIPSLYVGDPPMYA